MAANSRIASAVQILCVMARIGDATTSEVIARSLQTNAVVVRRLLKSLEQAGLVALSPGKDGGVRFVRPAEDITLDDVFRAVETDRELFALRAGGNPNCIVDRNMKRLLAPVFHRASEAVADVLGQTTIGALAQALT